jgi:hypothetical protein
MSRHTEMRDFCDREPAPPIHIKVWKQRVGTVKKSTATNAFTFSGFTTVLPWAHQIRADTTLADVDGEFEEFSLDARGAPRWIIPVHGAD